MFHADYGRLLRPALCALALTVMGFADARAQGDQMPSPEQIAVGDSIFNGRQLGACWACHGKEGKGSAVGPKLNDSEWLNTDGSLEGIKATVTSGVPKPKKAKTPMPPMGGGKYTPEQVEALAAYVYSLSHKS